MNPSAKDSWSVQTLEKGVSPSLQSAIGRIGDKPWFHDRSILSAGDW
jgi:hypothetical protein